MAWPVCSHCRRRALAFFRAWGDRQGFGYSSAPPSPEDRWTRHDFCVGPPLGIMSTSLLAVVVSGVVVLWWVTGVFGLRLVSLDVPTAVMQGDGVWLNCTLDLESDELYSVKWYKDDVEFYRFLPRDSPAGQKYDLPGVFVDLEKSRQGKVYLYKTDLYTEGVYRCEASAESPTFQTVEGGKQIMIYVLPQEDPTIQGSLPRYEVGDYVNVTCRSGPSKPAATLKWFINGKEATSDFEIHYPTLDHPNGLQTSSLGLTFLVSARHLHQGGAIALRCTAIVSQAYSTTSEEVIIGDRATESSSPSASVRDGPIITGGQVHYRIDDLLDVNCSSSKSSPAPELHWFINDEKVEDYSVIRYPNTRYVDGQESSMLGLRFRVQQRHFDDKDEMRLKCTATVSKVINMRSDEKIAGGNHRSSGLHVAENVGKVSSRSGCASSQLQLFSALTVLFSALPFL